MNAIESIDINSLDYKKTSNKMNIAVMIDEGIKAKGYKYKDFASRLNRTSSEISKWLSGTHNFTIDTLTEIEEELNITLVSKIINIEENNFCYPCYLLIK